MSELTRRVIATETRSPHNRVVALVLAIFFGYFGVHRLYLGKFWTAALWFVTGGLFGFGWAFDVIMLLLGRFKDSEGRVMGPPQYQEIGQGQTYRAMPVPSPKPKTEDDIALDELDADPLEEKFKDLEKELKTAR